MEEQKKPNLAVAIIVAVALIGLVTAAVVVSQKKDTPTSTQNTQVDTSTNQSDKAASDTDYKDGTYSATGNYTSPGGRESVDVTLTLKDGIITDATVKGNASGGEAEEYQGQFISGFKAQVVGKDVDDVSLSRVAGSSLTSGGFNEALEQIKQDATIG